MALKKPTPAFENENGGVATAETCQTRNEAAVSRALRRAAAQAQNEVAVDSVMGDVARALAIPASDAP